MIKLVKDALKDNKIYIKIRSVYWKVKRKIRSRVSKIYRFYTLRILYPTVYKRISKSKIDNNKVVFVEVRMEDISDSFKLLYEELNKNYSYEITTHFLGSGFVSRRENIKRSKEMVKDIGNAKYVFLNESSDVISCLPMRKETVVTQLWHGCGAFKKFGMSTADLIFGDDRKTLMKYPYHKNYTHVTVSSPEVIWAYEEAMSYENKKGVVKATGISRTDYFFHEDVKSKAFEKLYKEFPQARDKKVILYAPTFRGRVAKAKTPDKLDIELLGDKFKKEYVLVLKHHPFVKKRPQIPEGYKSFAKDLTDEMTIEDLLLVSDICISDYSSLVFEYSLFLRPMIFFAYDLDNYCDWRGFYYDFKTFVPGPIFTENNEIVDYIADIDAQFDKEKVIRFRDKFMGACDGHSTERIMELVFGKSLKVHRK